MSKARRTRQTAPKRRDLELVYVPVDKLRLWKDNPRENDEAAELLCEMLNSHGFINPIIATQDNVVRAGNTRLKSARLSGLDKVPVIYVDFDSEFDAEMYSISDNKAHEFARWKKGLLASLLSQRRALDVSPRSGFSPLEIERMRITSDGIEGDYERGPMSSERQMGPMMQYAGGKSLEAPWILSYMPPHDVYVEVFAGAGSVLFGKAPSGIEVLNDRNEDLINLYRTLRSKKFAPRFLELCQLTLHSRKEWRDALDLLRSRAGDKVTRAHAMYVAIQQAFGGKPTAWAHAIASRGSDSRRWGSAVARLPKFHDRLLRCQIENLDFRKCIEKYDQPGTLLYLDPPYVPETRVDNKAYMTEMSTNDHRDLIELLLAYPAMTLLSGYEHPLYEPLVKVGWILKKRVRVSNQAGRTRATVGTRGSRARFRHLLKTECLWINPAAQVALAKARRVARKARRVRVR